MPFLRDFTRAAVEAPIPVLLGGHSLMSGGLMALNEFAWAERDAGGSNEAGTWKYWNMDICSLFPRQSLR